MIFIPDRAAGVSRADPSIIEQNLRRGFILSDTHWWHDNIVTYHQRPETHTELIIERWRHAVRKDDIVRHLGDVVYGIPSQDLHALFPTKLPGHIFLVPGNHAKAPRIEVFVAASWQLLDPFSFAYRDHLVCFTHESMPPEEGVDGADQRARPHPQPAVAG